MDDNVIDSVAYKQWVLLIDVHSKLSLNRIIILREIATPSPSLFYSHTTSLVLPGLQVCSTTWGAGGHC